MFVMPPMVRPCPRGKVKCDHRVVITIGQLARYAGVSIKTIRVYHDKGLLAEPDVDAPLQIVTTPRTPLT